MASQAVNLPLCVLDIVKVCIANLKIKTEIHQLLQWKNLFPKGLKGRKKRVP
jgi:hypothetical protein